jgi:electron transfer flavoprotein alpha subunit
MTILVFSEQDPTVNELLAKAREMAPLLGGQVIAVAYPGSAHPENFFKRGADRVIMPVSPGLTTGVPIAESYAEMLLKECREISPSVILIGSTRWGKEVASRLAGMLGCGCAVDCSSVSMDSEKRLSVERLVLGGNAIATEQFSAFPAVVTVPAKVIPCLPEAASSGGELEKKSYELAAPKVVSLKVTKREVSGVKLDTAQVVVSMGRGIKAKEDIRIVLELAKALNGELGCTRPIAADLKWLPKEHWVGLSGIKVKPKVYLAVGISGQIQHIAGMRDSALIVAINKDKDAPIFKAADYGIIGDLYKVLPELMTQLKTCK